MSDFVKALRTLYIQKRVTLEKIEQFKTDGKITQEEYETIIADVEDYETAYKIVRGDIL